MDPVVVDGVDVSAVEAAVTACAGVSRLVGGRFGDMVTYLPGRRVPGVEVDDRELRVQVRARWGVPVVDVAAQIDVATAGLRHGRPLTVVVADLEDPPGGPDRSVPAVASPGVAGVPVRPMHDEPTGDVAVAPLPDRSESS